MDTRSIVEVSEDDARGFDRAHFFAGVAGWELVLQLAGWPDWIPVWTGSCPCQPWSGSGKKLGAADERHLWPEWHRLILASRPPVVFGEQVATGLGPGWMADVRAQMEDAGYAVGVADLCAASVGAPHKRQRFWFGAVRMADFKGQRLERHASHYGVPRDWQIPRSWLERYGQADAVSLADRNRSRCLAEPSRRLHGQGQRGRDVERRGEPSGMGDAGYVRHGDGEPRQRPGQEGRICPQRGQPRGESHAAEPPGAIRVDDLPGERLQIRQGVTEDPRQERAPSERAGAVHSGWTRLEWLWCSDGKLRPTEPGLFPLAHGFSGKVAVARDGRTVNHVDEAAVKAGHVRLVNRRHALRAAGNAIVPQVGASFVRAFMSSLHTLGAVP